jgi:hypothetical protein
MKYDAKYFLEKFDKIPEDKWITGKFIRGDKRCALGWCGQEYSGRLTIESMVLYAILYNHIHVPASIINDGRIIGTINFTELGDTPKERIMNALILIEAGVL